MNQDTDCLACDGKNPVNWLLTRLNPSATIRVCEHDIRTALATLLATEMDVEADWLIDVINEKVEEMSSLQVVADTPYEHDDGDQEPFVDTDSGVAATVPDE
jgi:hypothetical protein